MGVCKLCNSELEPLSLDFVDFRVKSVKVNLYEDSFKEQFAQYATICPLCSTLHDPVKNKYYYAGQYYIKGCYLSNDSTWNYLKHSDIYRMLKNKKAKNHNIVEGFRKDLKKIEFEDKQFKT